jgi:hypothetical protein
MFFSPPSLYAAKILAMVERERAKARLTRISDSGEEMKEPVAPAAVPFATDGRPAEAVKVRPVLAAVPSTAGGWPPDAAQARFRVNDRGTTAFENAGRERKVVAMTKPLDIERKDERARLCGGEASIARELRPDNSHLGGIGGQSEAETEQRMEDRRFGGARSASTAAREQPDIDDHKRVRKQSHPQTSSWTMRPL